MLSDWVTVSREAPGWTTLLSIGSVSAVLLAAGVLLGWWLDETFHTSPILVVIGTALGVIGGVCYSVVQLMQFLKQ